MYSTLRVEVKRMEEIEHKRRRRQHNQFESVDTCLPRTLDEEFHMVEPFRLHSLIHHWKSVVGPTIAAHTKVLAIEPPKIVICAYTSAWMQQLQMQQRQLLRCINEYYKESVITTIQLTMYRHSFVKETATPSDIDLPHIPTGRINFSKLTIPDASVERIDRICALTDNKRLQAITKKIQIEQEKKNHYLQKQGYVRCPNCGNWMHSNHKICANCKSKHDRYRISAIKSALQERPYMKYDEIINYGQCTLDEFNRARSELLYFYLDRIYHGSVSRQDMYMTAMLLTFKRPEELTDDHVINLCHKRRSNYLSDEQIERLRQASVYREKEDI